MVDDDRARLAVLGDSIAAGLGAQGRQFPILIAEDLDLDLIDLSGTAKKISRRDVPAATEADVVLIAHGITEAILRPTASALRWVPPRWRRPGWLDPRPYFSQRPTRRVGQRVESALRWRTKTAIMRVSGREQWLGPQAYEETLREMVQEIGPERVILIGGFAIDDRFFPGSAQELARYADISRSVAAASGARFVDVDSACRPWEDYFADHFHPNGTGHRRIADVVGVAVGEVLGRAGATDRDGRRL